MGQLDLEGTSPYPSDEDYQHELRFRPARTQFGIHPKVRGAYAPARRFHQERSALASSPRAASWLGPSNRPRPQPGRLCTNTTPKRLTSLRRGQPQPAWLWPPAMLVAASTGDRNSSGAPRASTERMAATSSAVRGHQPSVMLLSGSQGHISRKRRCCRLDESLCRTVRTHRACWGAGRRVAHVGVERIVASIGLPELATTSRVMGGSSPWGSGCPGWKDRSSALTGRDG